MFVCSCKLGKRCHSLLPPTQTQLLLHLQVPDPLPSACAWCVLCFQGPQTHRKGRSPKRTTSHYLTMSWYLNDLDIYIYIIHITMCIHIYIYYLYIYISIYIYIQYIFLHLSQSFQVPNPPSPSFNPKISRSISPRCLRIPGLQALPQEGRDAGEHQGETSQWEGDVVRPLCVCWHSPDLLDLGSWTLWLSSLRLSSLRDDLRLS